MSLTLSRLTRSPCNRLVFARNWPAKLPSSLLLSRINHPSSSFSASAASKPHSFVWKRYPGLTELQQKRVQDLEGYLETSDLEVQKGLEERAEAAIAQQKENKSFLGRFDIGSVLRLLTPPKRTISELTTEVNKDLGVAIVSGQGQRSKMEDAHLVTEFAIQVGEETKQVIVTGVFDGHRGDECSKFSALELPELLKRHLEFFNPLKLTDRGIVNALSAACVNLSQNYMNQPSELADPNAGTTANIVVEIEGNYWIANVGDSRAILVTRAGESIQLSEDGKPSSLRHANRVRERFGTVEKGFLDVPRVNGVLAVAGAIGNLWANGAVSACPDTVKLDSEKDDLAAATIIQCCDGVWDVLTTEKVGAICFRGKKRKLSDDEIAHQIFWAATNKGSSDNLSILVRSL